MIGIKLTGFFFAAFVVWMFFTFVSSLVLMFFPASIMVIGHAMYGWAIIGLAIYLSWKAIMS